MNINELHDAWITAGQTVSDKQSTVQNMAIELANGTKDYSEEEVQAAKDSLESAKRARDLAKEALDGAEADNKVAKPVKAVAAPNDNGHKEFAAGIRDLIAGRTKALNLVSSSSDPTTTPGAGLTIPEDVETRINELIRQFDVLQPLVNVESTATTSGSRVIEVFGDMLELADIDDEDAEIADMDEPKLKTIKYEIHRRAGIMKATNSLLKDSDEAIITWLTGWIAKKVAVTRNKAIIKVLNTLPKTVAITNFDSVKDLAEVTLDPAISAIGSFLTNVSGFAALKKVKDAQGNYLLQRDVSQSGAYTVDGKAVTVVSDNWLPDTDSKHPLYFGSLKNAVTLFDRENLSLATTTEGGDAFTKDQTWIRAIDRFDVELTDDEAVAVGSFSSIADNQAAAPKA